MSNTTPETINNAVLLGNFASGTSEWHEMRAQGIGGSEAGTIMGLNPYESPYALWAKKTGQIPIEPVNNWAVRFGQKFEEPILELLQEEYPSWQIMRVGTYAHKDRSYFHANPDAIGTDESGQQFIIEVKTGRSYWDVVPPAYIAQVRYYMHIFDMPKALICGVVGMNWVEHWVERDMFEEQVMLQKLDEFWNYCQTETAPDFDGATSTYEVVRKMHPEITDDEVEIEGLFYLANAQEKYDSAQAELNKAKSEVLAMMGQAKHAYMEKDGQRYYICSRKARAGGTPYLVVNK